MRFEAPEIATWARELLKGYRSPYSGQTGDECPLVHAGFRLTNSETGWGKWKVTPELTVKVCSNGMVMSRDALGGVHLGGKLEQGVIKWSEDTERKNLETVKAKVRDAVVTFLDVDYLKAKVAELEAKAGVPVVDAVATVTAVGKKLLFSEADIKGTLDHFIRGSQITAGGVLQAVTSYAQMIEDADAAYDLQAKGIEAMELAFAMAR